MTSPEVINCLKGHDLFAGIKEEILNAFVTKAVVKSFSKGKILYIENDQAEFFYFIKKGWIKLFNETLDGTEAIIDILTCNHVFGETAIFDNGLYTSSAEVVEDTVLVLIPTSVLKENLERDKTFIANMFAAMSKHRKCQEREIEHLTIQNAPQR
ncbi:MAG: transcriptional regulator, Crp/Fnr family, partial [Rickettsiaceae bacterium]|nr:transcriptional regulator, Crp/Fnr family [Rickettsiaceae bacterium]